MSNEEDYYNGREVQVYPSESLNEQHSRKPLGKDVELYIDSKMTILTCDLINSVAAGASHTCCCTSIHKHCPTTYAYELGHFHSYL